mmetsp:Transcript_6293/g.11933  ORF Transcript_6293/g.11933 Transcript_6293/m.11933 type:complete len:90 (-) Transcript_6293:1108-1377(-)
MICPVWDSAMLLRAVVLVTQCVAVSTIVALTTSLFAGNKKQFLKFLSPQRSKLVKGNVVGSHWEPAGAQKIAISMETAVRITKFFASQR